jgi:aminopeptidase YwaD
MTKITRGCFSFLCVWALCAFALGQSESKSSPTLCPDCIRRNLESLASDSMRGRGSGTEDEHRAAEYIGSRLREYHIQPVDSHGYVQEIALIQRVINTAPTLSFAAPGAKAQSTFVLGKDFLTLDLVDARFSGPLQKIDVDSISELPQAKPGAVILVTGKDREKIRSAVSVFSASPAVAVLMRSSNEIAEEFEREGEKFPELPPMFAGQAKTVLGGRFNGLALSRAAVAALSRQPDGTVLRFSSRVTQKHASTWNAVGMLEGSDPTLQHAAILFSAHLDHIGVGKPVHGDRIYNGADDDASGCTAVLEIARVLGAEPRPKRTVIFALFGSEEVGGTGATYFREHPPLPLTDLAANLEFEMIGRADPAVNANTLWLTGWERSNLGPTLASHGAHLVGDPHPEQDFFTRSDNYVLAKKGVVAQTISSYGLHSDYHQPSDDVAHIDFKHMDEAIDSLLVPVEWLVNSDFRPQWNQGGRP